MKKVIITKIDESIPNPNGIDIGWSINAALIRPIEVGADIVAIDFRSTPVVSIVNDSSMEGLTVKTKNSTYKIIYQS